MLHVRRRGASVGASATRRSRLPRAHQDTADGRGRHRPRSSDGAERQQLERGLRLVVSVARAGCHRCDPSRCQVVAADRRGRLRRAHEAVAGTREWIHEPHPRTLVGGRAERDPRAEHPRVPGDTGATAPARESLWDHRGANPGVACPATLDDPSTGPFGDPFPRPAIDGETRLRRRVRRASPAQDDGRRRRNTKRSGAGRERGSARSDLPVTDTRNV